MKIRNILLSVILSLSLCQAARGQMAIKTNLLYDITASLSAGAEFVVAPQWSVEAMITLNEWTKWKCVMFQPEGRYWFDTEMQGHFLSANAILGYGDAGLVKFPKILSIDFSKWENYRYKGPIYGFGVGYGYCLPIGAAWGIEFQLALGVVSFKYDKYDASSEMVATGVHKTYFYPTKVGINLMRFF